MAEVVRRNPASGLLMYETAEWRALETLFGLLGCPVPPSLKGHILNVRRRSEEEKRSGIEEAQMQNQKQKRRYAKEKQKSRETKQKREARIETLSCSLLLFFLGDCGVCNDCGARWEDLVAA